MRSTLVLAATVFAVNAIAGIIFYPGLFIFAYYEGNGLWWRHVLFLVLIAIFALICGLLAVPLTARQNSSASSRARFAMLTSFAFNFVILGMGSIVSARHKSDGSVSQGFSTATDVLVTSVLLAGAALCIVAAWLRSPRPDR